MSNSEESGRDQGVAGARLASEPRIIRRGEQRRSRAPSRRDALRMAVGSIFAATFVIYGQGRASADVDIAMANCTLANPHNNCTAPAGNTCTVANKNVCDQGANNNCVGPGGNTCTGDGSNICKSGASNDCSNGSSNTCNDTGSNKCYSAEASNSCLGGGSNTCTVNGMANSCYHNNNTCQRHSTNTCNVSRSNACYVGYSNTIVCIPTAANVCTPRSANACSWPLGSNTSAGVVGDGTDPVGDHL